MLESVLLFLVFAALGVYQAAPSVTTGDAGEFAAAAASWGVPHAPGYATWTTLAKAFGSLIPVGDWAYRANLLSAVCAAAALVVLHDALRRWGAPRAARLGAVIVLGLTPLWREQSAVAEAFAPLALCGAGLLWLVAAAGERLLSPGPAAALGLIFGLSLGVHQTIVLVLPALLLAGRGKPGSWAVALGAATAGTVLGFSLHLAIPLRAFQSPPVDWGHATTWDAFLRLLLRRDYGTFALTVEGSRAFGPAELWAQLWRFAHAVYKNAGATGMMLAGLGAISRWPLLGFGLRPGVAAAWLFATGPLFLFLGRPGFDPQTSGALERFALLPMLGLVPFLAMGFAALGARVPAFAFFTAAIAGISMIPEALAASRRNDFLAHDYGRAIMRALPPKSVLVMDGGDDTFYSLAFLTVAAGLRRDVELRDRGGVVFPGGYGSDFRTLDKAAKERRRFEIEGIWLSSGRLWYSTMNDGLRPGAELAPAGLLRRPLAPKQAFPHGPALRETMAVRFTREAAALRYRDRALAAFIPYQRAVEAFGRGDGEAGVNWLESAVNLAPDALWVVPSAAYQLGVQGYRAMGRRDWTFAARAYAAGAALEPKKAEPMANLGVALERAGRLKEAEAAFREAIILEPRYGRAWSALGARLWSDSRWADAADAFASAAAVDPNDAASAAWAERARARAKGSRNE